MATQSIEGQLMNIVVRMVVPLRREFGRQLDVSQFLKDPGYAQDVLTEALESRDARLRDYAIYVSTRLMGARGAKPPPGTLAPTTGTSPSTSKPATDAEVGSDDELRARVLRKYTTGLR